MLQQADLNVQFCERRSEGDHKQDFVGGREGVSLVLRIGPLCTKGLCRVSLLSAQQ